MPINLALLHLLRHGSVAEPYLDLKLKCKGLLFVGGLRKGMTSRFTAAMRARFGRGGPKREEDFGSSILLKDDAEP